MATMLMNVDGCQEYLSVFWLGLGEGREGGRGEGELLCGRRRELCRGDGLII